MAHLSLSTLVYRWWPWRGASKFNNLNYTIYLNKQLHMYNSVYTSCIDSVTVVSCTACCRGICSGTKSCESVCLVVLAAVAAVVAAAIFANMAVAVSAALGLNCCEQDRFLCNCSCCKYLLVAAI
jgi:hypothetical protein